MKYGDLTGRVFGSLSVVGIGERRPGSRDRAWRCRCSCGRESDIPQQWLIYEKSKKCLYCKAHSLCRRYRSEYLSWREIRVRCNRPNDDAYAYYGGRGITVCDRWNNSFHEFFKDMGPKPGPEYSIDRINNDGNYELSNCRWATDTTQQNNRRNTVFVEFKGQKKPLAEWSREIPFKRTVVLQRLRAGWSVERAFMTPTNL